MRLGQGLPVNMIVLTALALLALVVIGAFFITGFGEASGSVNVVEADQADCQNTCQSISMLASNYASCPSLSTNNKAIQYRACANQFGDCRVTIRSGISCSCSEGGCASSPQELCSQLCGEIGGGDCTSHGSEEFFTYCKDPGYVCVVPGCTNPDYCSCNPSGCTCVTPPS